ncbi:MAG: HAD hydrolase-like protein [Candidatus Liptonbacteria bacterium]|nr:HAD hydrolase-like protein [Candidatus Liptonbacteria bacterium]
MATNGKTVLFDLDGTMVDSREGIAGSIRHAMTGLGYEASVSGDLCWCIGPPLRNSFEKLLRSSDANLIDKAIALYRQRFSAVGWRETKIYPRIPEVLDAVRGLGFSLCVATSKPQAYAARIVRHFGLERFFDSVYGSMFNGGLSDKGELIAYVLDDRGVESGETIMVGDHKNDIVGAKKCGVPCIAVLYGYGSEEELTASGATFTVKAPEEIPRIVAYMARQIARRKRRAHHFLS